MVKMMSIEMIDNFTHLVKSDDKYPSCYPIYIYTLSDETGVRYIGQTNQISTRFSSHKCNARYGRDKTKRGQWIKSLLDRKIEPTITAIEKCHASISNQRERHWINHYLEQGANLVNSSCWGGERPGAGRPKTE